MTTKTKKILSRDDIDSLKILAANNSSLILSTLGIQFSDGGRYYKGSCPIPSHEGDRNNRSAFCYWPETTKWCCFSHHCELNFNNDIFGLISGVKNCRFSEAYDFLYELLIEKNNTNINSLELKKEKIKLENKRIHENRLKFLRRDESSLDYLISRGFSIEILKRFEVGFWSRLGTFFHDRIVIPIRDIDGRIVGFTGRTIWPEDQWTARGILPGQKWLHGIDYVQYKRDGFHKSIILFNLYNAKNYLGESRSLFIVEGPFDGFKLSMAGIENWVALLGSSISSQQISLLVGCGISNVRIAMDNDLAGKNASDKIKKELLKYFNVSVINLPEGKDPGDLTIEQVKEIFK